MTNTMDAFRKRRAASVGALAVAALLALSGCAAEEVEAVETTVPVTTSEAPSPTPIFASDEEALAAAVAVVQAAADAEVRLTGQPGDPTAEFETVATGEYLEDLLKLHSHAVQGGFTYVGHQVVGEPVLQRRVEDLTSSEVTLYTCIDSGEVGILWNDGRLEEAANKDLNYKFEATVLFEGGQGRVERQVLWTPDTCE